VKIHNTVGKNHVTELANLSG